MEEIWKDIKNYEGIYQVSNLGKVRGVKRLSYIGRNLKGKALKLFVTIHGYVQIGLTKNNKQIKHSVHRLVAKHFIKIPLNKPFINHKDGDKKNNCVSNL